MKRSNKIFTTKDTENSRLTDKLEIHSMNHLMDIDLNNKSTFTHFSSLSLTGTKKTCWILSYTLVVARCQ